MSPATRFGALAIILALTGCAATSNPRDPLEGFNRAMFSFNDTIDQAALKPAATAYKSVLPTFVQIAIGNFFGNLGDVWSAVNNLLQGKVEDGLSDFMRVALNSTFGFAGLLDIGSEAGLPKHNEDFGQTLSKWGIEPGPYVVLPFLGSSTLLDTVALPLDHKADPWGYKRPVRWRNVGSVVRVVDQRAAVLDASNLIEEAAIDRYEFVRDAFFQRRSNRVNDGNEPEDNETEKPKRKNESSLNGAVSSLPDQVLQSNVALVTAMEPGAKAAVIPVQSVVGDVNPVQLFTQSMSSDSPAKQLSINTK